MDRRVRSPSDPGPFCGKISPLRRTPAYTSFSDSRLKLTSNPRWFTLYVGVAEQEQLEDSLHTLLKRYGMDCHFIISVHVNPIHPDTKIDTGSIFTEDRTLLNLLNGLNVDGSERYSFRDALSSEGQEALNQRILVSVPSMLEQWKYRYTRQQYDHLKSRIPDFNNEYGSVIVEPGLASKISGHWSTTKLVDSNVPYWITTDELHARLKGLGILEPLTLESDVTPRGRSITFNFSGDDASYAMNILENWEFKDGTGRKHTLTFRPKSERSRKGR